MINLQEAKVNYNLHYSEAFEIEDLEQRRLFINSEIDDSVFDTIVYHILRYNRIDKGLPREQRSPILLYINTAGGSVCAGYGVIDVILNSETPVYTINQALCASMGFLIFLAGHKRFSMPRSEFLMHDGSSFGYDSIAKLKDRMEFETIQLEEMTKKYVIERTAINEKLYEEKYRIEWYMLPQEAKKYGICDFIVGEDCSLNEIL